MTVGRILFRPPNRHGVSFQRRFRRKALFAPCARASEAPRKSSPATDGLRSSIKSFQPNSFAEEVSRQGANTRRTDGASFNLRNSEPRCRLLDVDGNAENASPSASLPSSDSY